MLIHEAVVHLASPTGTREVPLEDFFVSPGQTRLLPSEVEVLRLQVEGMLGGFREAGLWCNG